MKEDDATWALRTHGEMRTTSKILGRKPEGKMPLGRSRLIREYNTKLYLKERGWNGVDWSHLAQEVGRWRGLCEHGNA
jgi:hypothetical protein